MPANKFTAEEVLKYAEHQWDFASETHRGERLKFKGSFKGGALSYLVTHGDQELYSGTDVHAAVDAYQRA